MSGIEIVKATVSDAIPLQAISRSTFFETFADVNTEENMKQYLETNLALSQLRSEIENFNSEFYFAKDGSEVVAYMKLNLEEAQTVSGHPNTLEIERIYVLKKYHGQKIGSLLLEKALEIAKMHKHNFLWLGVWENNLKAIEFYKKNGFTVFDTHIFKLGEDEQNDLLMKIQII